MEDYSASQNPTHLPFGPFMTTTKFLAALLATLIALSVVASFWKPKLTKDGKTTLTWVSDNNPARTAQIAAFNEENPGLNLRLDYGNIGVQKIILQSTSGVGPDIFDFGDDQMESYVEAGVLWDVTDAANSMGFSGKEAGWPGGVDTYTYRDRQYGFPCNTGSSTLIFNKNVFDFFGIPYPDKIMTWDEFFQFAQKVNTYTNREGAKGQHIFAITGLEWRHFFESQRGEFFDEKGKLNILDNPQLRRAFDMHRDMIYKYRLTPTTVEAKQMSGQGGWGSGNLNQFAAGRYAMLIGGHWSLIAFGRAYERQVAFLKEKGIAIESIENPLDRPLRLGAILYPYFSGDEPHYRVGSRVAGINSRSPHREEALKFLQYLSGPTYSKLLNEGTDFLPGNPKYADLGAEPGPEDLSRPELQAATVKAMTYGYVPRYSPFLFMGDVLRVMKAQISRLESNSTVTTDEMLRAANNELTTLIRRNLDRNAELKKLFVERFGEEAYKNLR
jgi:ABC-type glycerol-3-phosphate transport system substrate-binding protein